MAKLKSTSDLEELRRQIIGQRDPEKPCVSVCGGASCLALGADRIIEEFKRVMKERGMEDRVYMRETGCPGFCERGPIVTIYPEATCYVQVSPEDVPEIVEETLIGKRVIDRLVYSEPGTGERVVQESEIPFYKYQTRLLMGNATVVNPTNIDDYLAAGGYAGLAKSLFQMKPDEVITEVTKSGLRGRGGGGFPTGRKWAEAAHAESDIRYVIVNADEGDPGAFMDRAVLEGNPHSVLEGLIIGAYAVQAHEGFMYIRAEYPLAVKNVNIAIKQATEYGLLGEDILGSGFSFTVTVHRGAGSFVSGESSALMTAIEGHVGEPRPKHIHTVVKGVWDRPSVLNNVETWANVPIILDKGADSYASVGTEGSTGTKIFSLVGKVNNTGLVEVPMGTSIRDIVFKIGGGIPGGKKFKAVQTGGPSGGCIPEGLIDSPVDFDELSKLGAMMGSGGMIVMDEDTCMVDVAKYFIDFLKDESCGKCTPCREGITQMLGILTDLCEGRGEEGDLELIDAIAEVTRTASLCALGQTAPNPVLTTIQYFRNEYEAHIREKRCPAGVCKALFSYYIDPDKCKACMICLKNCPVDAIIGEKKQIHVIDQDKCTKCGTCYEMCPDRFDAIIKVSGEVPAPLPLEKRVIQKGE